MTTNRVILLAVDGSMQAEHAFDWYYSYLHRPGSTVYLVHVPEGPTVATSQGMHLNEGEIQKMIYKEKSETESLQQKFLEKLAEKQVEATYKTVYGRPGESIVECGHEVQATMIVMGTRGQGKLRRTIMGSVSDYVVHHAHCPVVVCRQPPRSRSGSSVSRPRSGSSASRPRSDSTRSRSDSKSSNRSRSGSLRTQPD